MNFSTDQNSIFQEFKDKIQHEFIHESAIAPDLFNAAIEIVSDTQASLGGDVSYPIHEALNWHLTRFGAKARENLEAALLRNEDRSPWQAKLSRSLQPDKKPYLAPAGNGSRAFLPAITVEIWYQIAKRYKLVNRLPEWVTSAYHNGDRTLRSDSKGFGAKSQGFSFWQWVETHEVPIVLTEGGKKALCLLSHGYIAIALYGCDSGRVVNDIIAGEKVPKLKPELIPDLKPFATPGREVVFAFDQDAKFETRYKVSRALDQLGKVLLESGCNVRVATWNGQDGKGIDDLIVNCGIEAWETSYAGSDTLAQWRLERNLASEVRRRPNLNIGDREFSEVVDQLPKTGVLVFYGAKGSGKTTATQKLLEGRSWLSVTSLISLGRGQAADFDGVFVNDGDRHGSKLLKDGQPVDGGSVCIPSLLKVSSVEANVLILDEITAVQEFLLSSKLANKNGSRPLLLKEFEERVKAADLVVIADADLTEEAIQYIEQIRGEKAFLVKSERQSLTYEAAIIDGSKNAAIALLQRQIEQLPPDKVIYINSDEKAFTDSLAEIFGKEKTLLLTSDTTGGEVETRFLTSKGRDLPDLIANGIRYIVSSPSLVQGFSLQYNTHLINSVWGFYSGSSITAHSIAQAPDRVRDSQVPRFFWIANKGKAYSQFSKAQSVATWLKEFKQLGTTAARLVAHSLIPEAKEKADQMDWQSLNLKTLASLEVRRNRGMAALRGSVIALLKKEGKKVLIVAPDVTKAEIHSAKASIKVASQAINCRYCEAVAAAIDLTPERVEEFENRTEALTPDEALALTRYYLKEFYKLEAVLSDDVALDRKGRSRIEIKALEGVLYPDLATQRTAKSINQNPESPQDWKPDAVRVWLLEQSGAAEMIREIAAGEIDRFPADQVQSIAEFARSHSAEFRIAFGFKNVQLLPDQQIVGEILSRHAIRSKRCGNRNNLRYEVCKPELEAVLAIVNRRRKASTSPCAEGISPPEKIEVNQEGEIPQNAVDFEDLADITDLYQSTTDPEALKLLQKSFPPDLWARVINQIA